ncbi:hypothetical protein NPIL_498651, partial [Nephila pilipes]
QEKEFICRTEAGAPAFTIHPEVASKACLPERTTDTYCTWRKNPLYPST